MKKSVYKKTAMAAALLLGAGQASLVSAHDQAGTLLSASGRSATDVYVVECYPQGGGPASHHLTAQIQDKTAGGTMISLQIMKGYVVKNTTDVIGGDTAPVGSTANYSPEVQLNGGNGFYTILVNHTAQQNESYSFKYHCEAADGVTHTGSLINDSTFTGYPFQNQ